MAFADPMVVTINGAAKNLTRIDFGRGFSEYMYSDGTMKVTGLIRNVSGKPVNGRTKDRHTISLRQTVFATVSAPEFVRTASVSLEHYQGDDVTAFDDIFIALATYLTAPNALKLANFES